MAVPQDTIPETIYDNAVRGEVISKLVSAMSQPVPAKLESWSGPQECGDLDGESQVTPLGCVWQKLNKLRVMHHYTARIVDMCKGNLFLNASPVTCVDGLEWFSPLLEPLKVPAGDELEHLEGFMDKYCDSRKGMSRQRAAFEIQRECEIFERPFARLLLSYHFPESREYEVEVANILARQPETTYETWIKEFPKWRSMGLLYPMAVGAGHGYPLTQIAPSALQCPVVNSLVEAVNAVREPELENGTGLSRKNNGQLFAKLCRDWNSSEPQIQLLLASYYDRLAVLMGVKSNANAGSDEFDLKQSLKAFADSFQGNEDQGLHETNYSTWPRIKSSVERAFPPSVLCAPLVKPSRTTWGYSKLTLSAVHPATSAVPCVRFQENTLELVSAPCTVGEVHLHTPAFIKTCLAHQTSWRIQEALWRLGDVVCSCDVVHCMSSPLQALDQIDSPSPKQHLDSMSTVSSFMQSIEKQNQDAYMQYVSALESTIPKVQAHFFKSLQKILLWRVEIPTRAIILTGPESSVDPTSESQHDLEKILVNTKIQTRSAGAILSAPAASSTEDIRSAIRYYAATELSLHPSNTVLVKSLQGPQSTKTVAPVTCTTMAESLACFSMCSPSMVNVCGLGQSCEWKEDEIDPRYAERQLAENGFRYRDWVAMHVCSAGTQQSRLSSHLIEVDAMYSTKMPLISPEGEKTRWVRVFSTCLSDNRTLHGVSLKMAVEARFLHDLRLLPRVDSDMEVSRSNVDVYTDGENRVALAYVCSGHDKIELMMFELNDL